MISEYKAKKYCCEDISLIENYDKAINDPLQTWDCHHRRETVYTADELIEIGEYYNRPAIELIFMAKADHVHLHNKIRFRDETTKKALSNKMKGINGKKILQYTKSGEFVREWQSAMEAQRQLSISQSHICQCCKGVYKSAGGYVWRYIG